MNAFVTAEGDKMRPAMAARLVAGRLQRIGIDPHQSANSRYLVLLEDAPGEIIELGRPLRETRFFKPTALRRDIRTVRDIEAFANDHGHDDWLFWNVGIAGAKVTAEDLRNALADFNRRLNIDFTELRKRNGFELLMIAVHPRFDPISGLFDLHAHFICRVPEEHREHARRRLLVRFSKPDLPDDPVRNPAACATYMLWGVFPPEELLTWPDHALGAAWELTQSRARFVRSGGSFAKWKRSGRDPAFEASARAERARRRENRKSTMDPRRAAAHGDRFLAKVWASIAGKRVPALLFEYRSKSEGEALGTYPSATRSVTQDRAVETPEGLKKALARMVWRAVRPRAEHFGLNVIKQSRPHLRVVFEALMRCRDEALERLRRSYFRLRDRIRK